jgi:hypothetical protein
MLISFSHLLQQLSHRSNDLKAFAEFMSLQKATKEKVPALQKKVDYIKSLFEVIVSYCTIELKQATFLSTRTPPKKWYSILTNFGGILHHSARVRMQKILRFVICVEDYHKLVQTQFSIQPPPPAPLGNLSALLTKTSLA